MRNIGVIEAGGCERRIEWRGESSVRILARSFQATM